MEILKVYYYSEVEKRTEVREFAISDWYCKPSILRSLAFYFKTKRKFVFKSYVCVFLTCSRFKCRQFTPFPYRIYPVHSLIELEYKEGLLWIVPEFNECAYDNLKDKSFLK